MSTTKPPEILYFTSLHCIACPIIDQYLDEILEETKLNVEVKKIDAKKNPHIAEQYNVLACSTLIFSDFKRIIGKPEKHELFAVICEYVGYHSSLE